MKVNRGGKRRRDREVGVKNGSIQVREGRKEGSKDRNVRGWGKARRGTSCWCINKGEREGIRESRTVEASCSVPTHFADANK